MSSDSRPDPGLLAEYAEGLLDGTPAGQAVRARLAVDPAWAATYAELTTALAAVRGDLAALGPAGPVPADVVARIDAALTVPAATAPAADRGPGGVRPFRARGRVFALTGAAAAALVGVWVVTGLGGDGSAPPGRVPPDRVGQTVVTSTGTDYAAAAGALRSSTADTPFGVAEAASASPAVRSAPVPAALARLTSPGALAACLDAVRHHAGPRAPAARSADFGRFAGVPALVVTQADAPSVPPHLIAVGPNCGAGGADLLPDPGGTP